MDSDIPIALDNALGNSSREFKPTLFKFPTVDKPSILIREAEETRR
jgi:hypothetical protein